jgi:hypothetical protein
MKLSHSRVPQLNAEWEFSVINLYLPTLLPFLTRFFFRVQGWGSMRYLDISPEDQRDAETRLKAPREVLGHLSAMSVSGNDVSGSVFYAFPLVFASAGELELSSELRLLLKSYSIFLKGYTHRSVY